MKAMILAAGLGTRMRPLTDHCPKPLLPVAGKPLIVHHLERLAAAGIHDIVINVSYRAQQIIDALGNGERFGVSLTFSIEETPLETAGGLRQALPELDEAPFVLVNGDVWTDFPLERLALAEGDLASLAMVDTADFHRRGDFHLDDRGRLHAEGEPRLIYAGLGVIHPRLIADLPVGTVAKLAPLLVDAMQAGRVGGWHHRGDWVDVGTPERLAELEARLVSDSASS
ncbi:mannose-1-phosphate guanylyltransferase [Salinicola sp. MH3R3-1]|uniref:N-acetylmuramate alpha-1-phosphate uridylyltransferase MurU n=1 Tax=Salinicola sp. MH3R3-1 TaxID=1928762 RepID=UPI00094E84B6|nr:nucleotidyltransferase family protein [Salinicola sp. MH3R3-1]OLO06614.1 mannose-1-phosphate guanylyltransferase [Salinicola sp. MH3R3-1]